MSSMDLRSTAFPDHSSIPDRYTKDHENLSPPLEWSGVPDGAVEFALSCIDPDAPVGTFVHWSVASIDSGEQRCDEGKIPPGAIEGVNGFGEVGYGGPQPPKGDEPHRYFFRIHALNRRLDLNEGFSYDELQRGLAEAEIATGVTVGTYARPK